MSDSDSDDSFSLLKGDPFEEDKKFPQFTVALFKSWLKRRIELLQICSHGDLHRVLLLMFNSGEYIKEITQFYHIRELDSENDKLNVFCRWLTDKVESKHALRTPEIMINEVMMMMKNRKEDHYAYLSRLRHYSYLINLDFEGSVNVDRLFWSVVHRNTNSFYMRSIAFDVLYSKLYENGKDKQLLSRLKSTARSIDLMNEECKRKKPRRRPRYCISCLRSKKCDCCYVCGSQNHFARDCPID